MGSGLGGKRWVELKGLGAVNGVRMVVEGVDVSRKFLGDQYGYKYY
jgi:hypothetical protein